ncbi:YadA-like family protein [Sphingomonas sp. QA11]|uniref:YadA-like family protein n=1 Tax=Sphingomonas sp. QA11 TaxID=2950605 RepID=UPI00234B5169|nr:YadA-like family protein [Sphingomonas sp. QA11]WCM28663.1 YadA-like family protein [Sphingomonas sp. QA11]
MSACSGVSLPRSVVTGIMTPVINGVVTPIQGTVNPILGAVGGLLGIPNLNIDTVTLLNNAASGAPITLQVLNANGTVVGPADRCDLQADSFGLNTQGGISIGGNRITGLGTNGREAVAGEINSIAFGNSAATDATSANSIALGTAAIVGPNAAGGIAFGAGAHVTAANSIALGTNALASRGALAGYTALGLTTPQTSVGEFSVGAAGAERQITNVAAGSAPTDAVNVAQLSGVAAQLGGLSNSAVLYDGVDKSKVTLGGAAGTTITNLAPGALTAASTDAVNGSQLFATNGNVTTVTNAVTNLTTNIQNGSVGTVRYSNPGTPTVPNGGTPTNDLTLVGAAPGAVGLHNVRDGVVAAGSTDAINGGQFNTLSNQVGTLNTLAVQYDDATKARVTFGGTGAPAVVLGNVAAGLLATGSTEAVNGGQLVAFGNTTAAALGGATTYNPATNSLQTSLSYGGTNYGSVQGVFSAIDGAVNGSAGIRYFHVQSALGDSTVSGTNSIAIGPLANASAANSVALGTNALAGRGALAGYTALGLTTPQTSVGEISVGAAGAERQITNVAAGSAATDAVNVAQLTGVANQVASLGATSVQYDGIDKSRVTLGGAAGTTITNLAPGALTAASTDAVNGSQLFATNGNVTTVTNAVTNLTTNIQNGSVGTVQYSNPGTPTVPNGGTPTNDLALVGAAPGAVGLHNVRDGLVAAGSTDAINGGQFFTLNNQVGALNSLSVQYDDATKAQVTFGGTGAPPVVLGNVAAGLLATGSTQAVNGGQLFATNANVTTVTNAVTNLTTNIQNGSVGTVQYSNPGTPNVPNGGTATNDLALVGAAAGPVGLHNVRDGLVAAGSTDAINGGQFNTLSNQVGTLSTLSVQYDDATKARVTFGGTGAPAVVLGNVAAGLLATGSTEAVNGGQLVALGNTTAAALGGGSIYDPTTNSLQTSLSYGGTNYNSVQGVFSAIDGAVNGGAGIRYFHVQSALGDSTVSGTDSIAIGPLANVSVANSVALGTNSTAARGAQAGYSALGVATPQTSVGEVSVGAAGAERQITNVAAGSAATDAVNVAQLTGVANQVASLGATSVQYDGTDKSKITLGGAAGTTITNVAQGGLSATSTDAVNGSQLYATNVNVANNTTAINNLTNSIANGSAGPVQYSSPGNPTTPNGGVRTNDLTLVGAAAGPVGLHNVANGSITAGSTDAVNGGQVFALAQATANAVSYDTDGAGNRLNTITLAGGTASAPVTIANVAAGTVSAGSTQAVNGGQLYVTNQSVTAAQSTANTALALGQNSIQYDNASRTDVTLGAGNGGAPVSVHNVAAGTSATDAVNVSQLNSSINNALIQANTYTDQRLAAITFDIRQVRKDSYAGTAGALAAAGLPQAYEAGRGMVAMAGGTYQGESAFALGLSKAMSDGHTVVKFSGTYDTQGRAGGAAGIGYQF